MAVAEEIMETAGVETGKEIASSSSKHTKLFEIFRTKFQVQKSRLLMNFLLLYLCRSWQKDHL
jgi:hypothetical protein